MKKVLLFNVFFLIGILSVLALPQRGTIGVGVDLGYYNPDSFFGSDVYPAGSSLTDMGDFLSGGHIYWFFNDRISIEGRANIYKTNDDFPRDGYSIGLPTEKGYKYLGSGDFSVRVKPYDLLAIYYFKTAKKNIKFYGGLGWEHVDIDYFYHHDPKKDENQDYPDFTVSDAQDTIAVIGGVMVYPTDDFSVRFDVKYSPPKVYLDAALNADPITGTYSKEVFDLEGFSYQLGFTYYFSPWNYLKKTNKKIKSIFQWEDLDNKEE
jgi:hypothetical protein